MNKYSMVSKLRVPRELEIVLNGPIGPQRLRDDTVVIDEDGWYRTLTPSASSSAANEILFCNLDPQDPERHIDKIIADYHNLGLPLSWCVYPWTQPINLGERLLARGATSSNIRAYLGDTSLPLNIVDDIEIERVDPTSTQEIEAYVNTLSAGYELPKDEEAFRLSRYQQLCSGPNPVMHLFIARCNGAIAGCSGMIIKADVGAVHLTSSSVLPAFQSRGVFQSLIAKSLITACEMGITRASGHSNEKSAFWVERFGFKFIYAYKIYELKAASLGN